jgi:hypothetical protein
MERRNGNSVRLLGLPQSSSGDLGRNVDVQEDLSTGGRGG